MYGSAATTTSFQYKEDPSEPFSVGTYFTNVKSRSSGGDAYPSSDNSWAPFMRVVIQP